MKISIKKAYKGDTFSSLKVGDLFISTEIPDQMLIKLHSSQRVINGYYQSHYNAAQVGGPCTARFEDHQTVQKVTSIQAEV